MAKRQNEKIEPPKVIGAISKFAGTLVGTAVVAGRRIVETATKAEEEPLGTAREKAVRGPIRKKKKAATRTKTKSREVKKKITKKKRTASVKSSAKKVKKQKCRTKKS